MPITLHDPKPTPAPNYPDYVPNIKLANEDATRAIEATDQLITDIKTQNAAIVGSRTATMRIMEQIRQFENGHRFTAQYFIDRGFSSGAVTGLMTKLHRLGVAVVVDKIKNVYVYEYDKTKDYTPRNMTARKTKTERKPRVIPNRSVDHKLEEFIKETPANITTDAEAEQARHRILPSKRDLGEADTREPAILAPLSYYQRIWDITNELGNLYDRLCELELDMSEKSDLSAVTTEELLAELKRRLRE